VNRRIVLLGLLVLGVAFLLGVGWWWYAPPRSPPFKIVLQGSSGSSENLAISGGNLVVVGPKPGIFFGTVRTPGSQEQFTYVILFKYGHSISSHGIRFHCTSDIKTAETQDVIELDGKRIEAFYRVELDESLSAVANETLTIGGKSKDMTSGQVFLIDLTADEPTYEQKKVELPAIQSKLETTEDVERLVGAIRKSLESQDPEIKAFME
jgi:hypothetical protein